MASQQDLQELLRMLTTGRNKLSMLAAMGRVKALQSVDIRSVSSIATADLATITSAIGDGKAAKQLQTAAKNNAKGLSKKRTASDASLGDAKRRKSQFELNSEPQTPEALEASLALPQPTVGEEEISRTTIVTNRAPLVLAFAVSLTKFTMPEQPLSSRLSLAQAVVSANSRSKAVSLGITNGTSAEQDGWGHGQPKVKVMGREIYVLKRGGYDWKAASPIQATPEDDVDIKTASKTDDFEPSSNESFETSVLEDQGHETKVDTAQWAVSQSITLKKSTFVARSIEVSSPSEARSIIQQLLARDSELRNASHNITAWRIQGAHGVIEDSNDDGETGGGRHILGLLQSMNLTNMVLVVTRWYGGIFLGTDRWRLMSEVSRDSLSQRLRVTGTIAGEALWALDLETMKSTNASVTGSALSGMPIFKPESARAYILKAFASSDGAVGDTQPKKKTGVALEREKEHNLGLLLSALDLLFASWVQHLASEELDRRAWSWYMQVRPDVESGVAGWGGKGLVKLSQILDLRRKV